MIGLSTFTPHVGKMKTRAMTPPGSLSHQKTKTGLNLLQFITLQQKHLEFTKFMLRWEMQLL